MSKNNDNKNTKKGIEKEEVSGNNQSFNIDNAIVTINKYERRVKIYFWISFFLLFSYFVVMTPLLSRFYLITQKMVYEEEINDMTLRPMEGWCLPFNADENDFLYFKLSKKTIGSLNIYLTIWENYSYNAALHHFSVFDYAEFTAVADWANVAEETFTIPNNDTWYFIISNLGIIYESNVTFDLEFKLYNKQYHNWDHIFKLLSVFNDYFLAPIIALITVGVFLYQFTKWRFNRRLEKIDRTKEALQVLREEENSNNNS